MMKTKILVVDDDIDIVEPITLLLESEGYTVEAITKGEKTYTKIASFKPDMILLDILMSGSDGRTICKKVKEDTTTREIPIIMMSAHPGASKDSKQCGANDFIAKPFEIKDLLSVVERNKKK